MKFKRLVLAVLAAALSLSGFLFNATLFARDTGRVLDAVVEWGNGKAYFFKGGQYVRWDINADRVDAGYPKPINNDTMPGIQSLLR